MDEQTPGSMTDLFPLNGVRVMDLSALLPGPYCSRLLADFGAEVIKIERPGGGDWSRYAPPLKDGQGTLFSLLNRGKKSLTLDLKDERGRAIFLRLLPTADVLLETFRPGVMQRLRLGPEVLAEANPGLIHCSLSGYGEEGPYRLRAGHDLNFIGLTGLLDLTRLPDQKPGILGAPMADLTGGLWAAIGILLALLSRNKEEKPRRVRTSLLGAALACLPVAVAGHLGGQPIVRGRSQLTGELVCYQVYESKDGGYMTLAALEPQFWRAFCLAVGKEHLLDSQFAPANAGDPTYDELCALFRTRTREEWIEALADVDGCCEPVYDLEEGLNSAPLRSLGMLGEDRLLPPVRLTGPIVGSGPAPAQEGRTSVPQLGEHSAAILGELGLSAREVDELRDRGVV